jgi:hypothetical protein
MMPPQDKSWDELLETRPARPADELQQDMRHLLGIDARRVRHGEELPDVHGLAEDLGLD